MNLNDLILLDRQCVLTICRYRKGLNSYGIVFKTKFLISGSYDNIVLLAGILNNIPIHILLASSIENVYDYLTEAFLEIISERF